jgi:hypothetical protein
VLLTAELIFYQNHLRPQRGDFDRPVSGLPAFLSERVDPAMARIHSYGSLGGGDLLPNWAGVFGIPQTDSGNLGALPWYEDLYFENYGKESPFTALHKPGPTSRIPNDLALDLMNVRYIVLPKSRTMQIDHLQKQGYPLVFENQHGGGTVVFENIDALPRAFLVGALREGAPDLSGAGPPLSQYAWTLDPTLLETAAKLGIPSESPGTDAGTAELTLYRHAEVHLRASAQSPAILLLLDTWHPNWHATVDGVPTPVARANGAFRAIALPPGEHNIILRYTPRTLGIAGVVSLLTLILLLGWAWRNRWKPQHLA